MREPGAEPMVYILVLNWRGWRDTIECLDSVFTQRYGRFRVVVCDNDSGDGSLDRIEAWARGDLKADPEAAPWELRPARKPIATRRLDRPAAERGEDDGEAPLVLIETGGNLGFAGGNNVGLRYIMARGDAEMVWLLNNDTVVDGEALAALVELATERGDAGMIGSKLLHYHAPDVLQAAGGGSVQAWRGLSTLSAVDAPDDGRWDRVQELGYVHGASLLVRAATLRDIGLLDERYFLYSEEVDWCVQARRSGWRLLYAPSSRVWHKGGQSVGYGSALHDYYTVRSMLLFVQKFHPALLPVTFGYSLYRCLAPKVVRVQPGRFRAVLWAYQDFLRLVRAGPSSAPIPRRTFERARPVSAR